MERVMVREARAGDGEALSRIHREMASYYVRLAPDLFQMPLLDGFAEELDAQFETGDGSTLHLVAEVQGDVGRCTCGSPAPSGAWG
jgi:hypothetical protein